MTEGQNGKQCKIISLILVVVVVVGVVAAEMGGVQGGSTGRRSIKVSEGAGSLKIALFADLHFGENAWTEWGPLQDVHSIKVMSYVLHHETPDFVIYLGDVITANNIPIANASLYWDQAVSPTRDKGIPWARIFGNHDDAQFVWPKDWFSTTGIPPLNCSSSSSGDESCSFMGMTRLQLMDHDITSNKLSFDITSNKLSFSQNGPKDLWPSVSNYVIQISSSNDSNTPVAFLYFLDSGGGSYPEVISNAQVIWFNRTAQEINPESRVPEIIFWHVPSKAYDSVAPGLSISKPCVGSINEESVASQEEEHGMMKALEARSSVQAVFVGHNHGLDWCCPYKNFWLCFARHTGYGGYGSWARGARMLEIKEKPFSLKSWITMEDGNVHSHVDLSS